MEHVLVTGGGYIGTTLVPMLLDDGYKVRVLDRLFFGPELLPKHDHLEIVKADNRRLKPAYFEGIDHVIDLVAISNDPSGELLHKPPYEIDHASRVQCAKMAKAAAAGPDERGPHPKAEHGGQEV